MKQIGFSAIITLIIGMTVAYFAFYLNKEYVDLRYTLSEKIPTKFIETSPAEAVQQLVVKNNGNIPDMFESVNKKTVVHPLFKVGLSLLKRLPEAARLNSDG